MNKRKLAAVVFIALWVAACDQAVDKPSESKAADHAVAGAPDPGRQGQVSSTTGRVEVTRAERESEAAGRAGTRLSEASESPAARRLVQGSTAAVSGAGVKPEQAARLMAADAVRLNKSPPVSGHAMAAQVIDPAIRHAVEPLDRERYAELSDNPVKRVAEHPVSTFSIDVDTGAYANVRRYLNHGRLPPEDAVRVEEMINYFVYDYPSPGNRSEPFSITTRIAPAPWSDSRHLLLIGIKGYEVPTEMLPPANLVFLIDVSGSMRSPDKLELLKESLKLLSRRLRPQDRLSIVVYAGASGVVLEPIAGNRRGTIEAALDALHAGGSTNGGAGIRLAYAKARESFVEGGINRVILATDGDFNVGTVDFEKLKDLVERERGSGISLTTLGFGTGNLNERLMEQLADAGNGNYAYIDSLKEANKVLVQQMSGTLNTIAKDVKIQIEFNPGLVSEYRLIGYENRTLRREDFNNDKVDAGEIGAGHTVTALYEIALAGNDGEFIEPLRYTAPSAVSRGQSEEIAFLRLRYKAPGGGDSRLSEWPIEVTQVLPDLDSADTEFRFAAAVAGFGQLLRGGRYTGEFGFRDVISLARKARADDRFGYRGEFLALVGLAESLQRRPH
ncbi:MAG: VWA domain-containing protein [Gammaproteobacteria bacterium]|nr:VWA domain-containing protein [Gammaproteobacteria bacterium]